MEPNKEFCLWITWRALPLASLFSSDAPAPTTIALLCCSISISPRISAFKRFTNLPNSSLRKLKLKISFTYTFVGPLLLSGEPGSIPGRVTSGFSQVGIVPDDDAGQRVFSEISCFPSPYIPALLHSHLMLPSSTLKISLRAATKSLYSTKPINSSPEGKQHGTYRGGFRYRQLRVRLQVCYPQAAKFQEMFPLARSNPATQYVDVGVAFWSELNRLLIRCARSTDATTGAGANVTGQPQEGARLYDAGVEQRWNARVGAGVPRESSPATGNVRNVFHLRKSGEPRRESGRRAKCASTDDTHSGAKSTGIRWRILCVCGGGVVVEGGIGGAGISNSWHAGEVGWKGWRGWTRVGVRDGGGGEVSQGVGCNGRSGARLSRHRDDLLDCQKTPIPLFAAPTQPPDQIQPGTFHQHLSLRRGATREGFVMFSTSQPASQPPSRGFCMPLVVPARLCVVCLQAERTHSPASRLRLPSPNSLSSCSDGATVVERLARSPPTKANRASQSRPGHRISQWESCRTRPLVGRSSRGSPVSPTHSFRRRSTFTSITLVGSQ
ncbi:hypothetical protein PR048_010177, partial [Dryococelus australis]